MAKMHFTERLSSIRHLSWSGVCDPTSVPDLTSALVAECSSVQAVLSLPRLVKVTTILLLLLPFILEGTLDEQVFKH